MNDLVSVTCTKKGCLLDYAQINLDGVGTQPGSSPVSENLAVSFAGDRQCYHRLVSAMSPQCKALRTC
jgi:hypothetical protein